MKRELTLQFCLSASSHRMEQSWPTRDAGVQSSRRTPLCRQPGIDVQLIKSSERHMECAYYLMLPLDTGEQRPRIRFCRQRSPTLRQGSVEAQGRSGSYGCHGFRDAQPLMDATHNNSCRARVPTTASRHLGCYMFVTFTSGLGQYC